MPASRWFSRACSAQPYYGCAHAEPAADGTRTATPAHTGGQHSSSPPQPCKSPTPCIPATPPHGYTRRFSAWCFILPASPHWHVNAPAAADGFASLRTLPLRHCHSRSFARWEFGRRPVAARWSPTPPQSAWQPWPPGLRPPLTPWRQAGGWEKSLHGLPGK